MATSIYGADMKKTNLVADLSLYAALFKDIAAWDPDLQPFLTIDLRWLEMMVEHRGMPFLMIDMPEAGKVFDHAFSSGYLDARKLPHSFGRLRDGHKEFLSTFTRKIFNHSGVLIPEADPTAIFFLRQVLYLAKKVRKECSDAAILAEVEAFCNIDSSLRSPDLDWSRDRLVWPEQRLSLTDGYRSSPDLISDRDMCPKPLLRVVQLVADIVVSRFPAPDWRDIKPGHGPGAVADAKSGTDKYLFPNWPKKLEEFFPSCYFAQSREDLHLEVDRPMSLREPPAKLLAVPKTLKGPRMIASEPIAHQYCQKAMMRWLRENLPKPLLKSIEFKSQDPSRILCLEASRKGTIATVDLSAASDRLSCWLVERIYRTNPVLVDMLHACRTRWIVNSTGIGELWFLTLRKFACMGSSTTFPVQSICYAIFAIAAVLYNRKQKVDYQSISRVAGEIQVFGDDIIMPSSAVWDLALAFEHCSLKVNMMKTHHKGHFRESCGMDGFKGVDVTPLYLRDLELRDTADSLVSWIDVCNNAYHKGLWHLADTMWSKVHHEARELIPIHKTPLGCLTLRCFQSGPPIGKIRYNRVLHRGEVLGLSAIAKTERRKRETHESLLQYFVEEPRPETNWSSGFDVRNRLHLRKRWVPSY
jgi:hypothetical protein